MNIAQEMLTTFNDGPDFAQKGHNWWRIMGVWLRHWNQRQIIPMEPSRRAKIDKVRQVRSMGRFAHNFLRLQRSQGCTVNKEHYLEVMRRLRKAIRKTYRIVENLIMVFA